VESTGARAPGPDATAPLLDLRTERCPLNLLRAREALAALAPGARLRLRLGSEGAATVPAGVKALGHAIVASVAEGAGLALLVEVGAHRPTASATLPTAVLERFARQVVLPEVGTAGQQRLLDAQVLVEGRGSMARIAARYLERAGAQVHRAPGLAGAAGHTEVALPDGRRLGLARAADGLRVRVQRTGAASPAVELRGAPSVAGGALLADVAQRCLVGPTQAGLASLDLDALLADPAPGRSAGSGTGAQRARIDS
jgi:TusA-related sulfurtransferase